MPGGASVSGMIWCVLVITTCHRQPPPFPNPALQQRSAFEGKADPANLQVLPWCLRGEQTQTWHNSVLVRAGHASSVAPAAQVSVR